MPRTATPTLPKSSLIENFQAEIDNIGWQNVKERILDLYQQRLDKIQSSALSPEEISKKRFKKLSKNELITLALCFLNRIIELQQKGSDTEDKIRQLCEEETALLERGYPQSTIAKNHYPLYINLIRDAIARQELLLNQQNSYIISVKDRTTGKLEDIRLHYAQLALKYDDAFYLNMKRSTTTNNNRKQNNPKPVRLYPYLDKIQLLLSSKSYSELATGIAAATGRRFSEIVLGNFSFPKTPSSPYEFIFEGQLKKSSAAPAYSTYSLVWAADIIEAIARFHSLNKIQQLSNTSIRQINDSINAAVNYQVKQHFQNTGIVSVLEGESRVTVQNLRGVYGEIATHFFCSNRASFPKFLSSCLGHLIGDEAISGSNSPSTEHYFHYHLIDEQDKQIDSIGVMLDKNFSTTDEVQTSQENTHSDNKERQKINSDQPNSIQNIHISTQERFKIFQSKNMMSENDTLIFLMNEAQKVSSLERELTDTRHLISSLEFQLNELTEQRTKAKDTPQQVSSDTTEETVPVPKPPSNSEDAVMILVKSMSKLTDKLDLLLDRSIISSQGADQEAYRVEVKTKSTNSQHDKPVAKTEQLLNHAIDTIMAHNDRAKTQEDKWYIGISPLKDVINSQGTITRIVKQRKAEIDKHHARHDIDRYHNGNFHTHQGYTDFFDFS